MIFSAEIEDARVQVIPLFGAAFRKRKVSALDSTR
jgi:hypothetical protein